MIHPRTALLAVVLAGGLAACAGSTDTADGGGQGVAIAESGNDTEQATPTASDTVEQSPVTDGGSDGVADTETGTADTEIETTTGGIEAAATEIVGDPSEFSTDLNQPEDDRGVLNVNAAYLTTANGDHLAGAGNKLLVVDYEVYFTKTSNLFDNAFRLTVDGEEYPTLSSVNIVGSFGTIYNSSLVFEVPASAGTFELEGGIPAGTPGGLTAVFGLVFDPDAPAPAPATSTGLIDDADATEIIGQPAVVSTDITGPERATLTIDGARVTSRDGDFFAHEGTKLVVVEFTLSDFNGFSNVFHTAFRLQADDEWYSPLNSINELRNVGETLTTGTVFEVPASATSFVFEAGPPNRLMQLDGFPDQFTENPSATWDLVFS